MRPSGDAREERPRQAALQHALSAPCSELQRRDKRRFRRVAGAGRAGAAGVGKASSRPAPPEPLQTSYNWAHAALTPAATFRALSSFSTLFGDSWPQCGGSTPRPLAEHGEVHSTRSPASPAARRACATKAPTADRETPSTRARPTVHQTWRLRRPLQAPLRCAASGSAAPPTPSQFHPAAPPVSPLFTCRPAPHFACRHSSALSSKAN